MSSFSSPACASVFYVPFFSIRINLLLLHPVPFHQKPSHPICLCSISPHHQVKTERTFSTFQSTCCCSIWRRASSVPGITFSGIIFSSLINISSSCWTDTPLAIGPWFSCRALWVYVRKPYFPSAWCHFSLAAWAVRGKGGERKNTVSKNRTKECKLTAMKSIRRESVSPHIFNQSGQIEAFRRESAAEIGSRPKRYSVAPTSGLP